MSLVPGWRRVTAPLSVPGCYRLQRQRRPLWQRQILAIALPRQPHLSLITTLYLPLTPGPHPLWVFNHGKSYGHPALQARCEPLGFVRAMVRAGYAVAAPNRQGFGGSGGRHLSDWQNPQSGALCCAMDIRVALDYLLTLAVIDARRVFIAGHSYGALGSLAYAIRPHPGVLGMVNFAGGLRDEAGGDWMTPLLRCMCYLGKRVKVPSLWLYAEGDSFWSVAQGRGMFEAFTAAGAAGRFVAVAAGAGDGHYFLRDAGEWALGVVAWSEASQGAGVFLECPAA